MRLYLWVKDRLDPGRPNLILDPDFSVSYDIIDKLKNEGYIIEDLRDKPIQQQKKRIIEIYSKHSKFSGIILISSVKESKIYSIIKNSGRINTLSNFPTSTKINLNEIHSYIDKISSDINSVFRWIKLAKTIGNLKYQAKDIESRKSINLFLERVVDPKFFDFVFNSYNKLFTYGSKFLTINKAIDYIISLVKNNSTEKVLLVVIDCMAWDDYFSIKDFFEKTCDRAIFAMIPTLTFYSRISLCSGLIPRNFDNLTINDEKKLFYQKISNELGKELGIYIKNNIEELKNAISQDNHKMICFIYSKFDEVIHSEDVNKNHAYHKLQELFKRDLYDIIKTAKDLGWRVFITSDHGNIETFEKGFHLPKYLDYEGKRCGRVDDLNLIDESIKNQLIIVEGKKFRHLNNNDIFIFPKKRIPLSKESYSITHGGITIEELIIPFVEVLEVKKIVNRS
ncbi:PglZ domain protein [Methanocaldococcus sp. FS406-22]|uniref:PglZ domain-containing protein n=1 Tax=Methanocaldococcus sp. (strain FS406-22) TaxID=644281 RepID=UPI0001BF53C2|nr:PglZ domain-containing protein [Methanocaldococcus sp. FS406-22]ADC69582.1 PglZ domain protein [Methanocaldococcus sp. FS406-22]